MDTEQVTVPPEELAAEQAAIAPPKEEEVRAEIISEFGFDEDTDGEKIDIAVKKEMKNRETLSKAIGQKRTWRDKATKKPDPVNPPANPPADPNKDKDLSAEDVLVLVEAKVTHPDDIKEVKKSAKILGLDIAGALQDDLVKAQLKDRQEKRASAKAANIAPARPGSGKISDQEILDRASKGEVFEKGSPEAEALYWARRGGKRSS